MKGAAECTWNGILIGIIISYMTYVMSILFYTDGSIFFAPKTDCSSDKRKNEENEFYYCMIIVTAVVFIIFFSVLLKKRNSFLHAEAGNSVVPSWRPEISSPTEKILKEAFEGPEKTVILQLFPRFPKDLSLPGAAVES